jgi:hypothetical protein
MSDKFADLYNPDIVGEWVSKHQGLSDGMDLYDFMVFVRRALEVIERDSNPARRLNKAIRLQAKMHKVANTATWMAFKPFIAVRSVIKQAATVTPSWQQMSLFAA